MKKSGSIAALIANTLNPLLISTALAGGMGEIEHRHYWGGAYAGANVGGEWGYFSAPVIIGTFKETYKVSPGAFTGGAQVGYHWQMEHIITGIEFDLNGQNLEGANHLEHIASPFVATDYFIAKNDLQGAFMGNLGYTTGSWLFYATGGFAFARTQFTAQFPSSTNSNSIVFPAAFAALSQTLLGGTAGLGIEYAMTPNWRVGLEGRYTGYVSKEYPLGNVPAFALNPPGFLYLPTVAKLQLNTGAVFFKVNYQFETTRW